jgi:hypothetical protein
MSQIDLTSINFRNAFQNDFHHEFEPITPDINLPSPKLPRPLHHASSQTTSIEAYSLDFFQSRGIVDGTRHGGRTLYYYSRVIAAGESRADYYKQFRGSAAPAQWYIPAFTLDDNDCMRFWQFIQRNTFRHSSTELTHYENAKNSYWDAYWKAFNIAFPRWQWWRWWIFS